MADLAKIKALYDSIVSRGLPVLVPQGTGDAGVTAQVEALLPSPSGEAEKGLKSLLLLVNDELDASHTISQSMPSATGSYLHGIMHRREGDFSNAKYWFRKVGDHPNFPAVRDAALALDTASSLKEAIESNPSWDPYDMVDWVEQSDRCQRDDTTTEYLKAIQQTECDILFEQFAAAV